MRSINRCSSATAGIRSCNLHHARQPPCLCGHSGYTGHDKVTELGIFVSYLLYFFPHSFCSFYYLPLFYCLISILLFPCVSVRENTRALVPSHQSQCFPFGMICSFFFVSYCFIIFFLPWVGCVGLGSLD